MATIQIYWLDANSRTAFFRLERFIGWGWAIALGLWPGLLLAAESPTNYPPHSAPSITNDILVTALRLERTIPETPATVFKVGPGQFQGGEMQRTTPDQLQNLPSVMVQKTSYGQGSPYLRGFTGFRTLFMIDGIRLNNSVFRDGPNQYWNTVDPFSIDDYEVVLGPASVLYGSDAVGGAVNAQPISPTLTETPEQPVGGRLLVRTSTAEESWTERMEVSARPDKNLGVVAGLTFKDYGDLEGGSDVGTQPKTGYDESDGDLRAVWAVSPSDLLIFGYQSVVQDDVWRTHSTVYGIEWKGLSHGSDKSRVLDQERQLAYLTYVGNFSGSAVDEVRLTSSWQEQEETESRVKKDDVQEHQTVNVDTWGETLQLTSETDWGDWVYGIDYYLDGVDSSKSIYNADGSLKKREIQGPVADDAQYETLGFFVQDSLGPADRRYEIIPGFRYTYAHVDANKVKDPVSGDATTLNQSWDAWVGSLRAQVRPWMQENIHVFAGLSQGFRAPNLSDLTRLDIARSGEFETPVSDLDPERFLTGELGIKSAGHWGSAQLTAYWTAIDDMIVRTPTGNKIAIGSTVYNEVTKLNAGDGHIAGVEWYQALKLGKSWTWWLSASAMDGQIEGYPTSSTAREEEAISRLMPPTLSSGLRWQDAAERIWTEGYVQSAEKADRLSAADRKDTERIPPGGTPGYCVGGFRAGWRINRNWSTSLSLENITDEDYRIHGSGVNEPGRNLIAMATYRF